MLSSVFSKALPKSQEYKRNYYVMFACFYSSVKYVGIQKKQNTLNVL